MPISFLNVALLAGIAAVVIPPIIHLLSRRRHDVVAWGAMQFLIPSERSRRKILIEDYLLMALRMGLIAVLAAALAAPVDRGRWLEFLAARGQRDLAFVVDSSYSMGFRDAEGGTAQERAREWAIRLVNALGPGDAVAVIQARELPQSLVPRPSQDLDEARAALQSIGTSRGSVDGPAALQAAVEALGSSTKSRRDIVVLTDHQRVGWADDRILPGWEALARALRAPDAPGVHLVSFAGPRPARPANRVLGPVQVNRVVASVGQQIQFQSSLRFEGAGEPIPPKSLRLEINRAPAALLPIPAQKPEQGVLPISFRHRFTEPGSYLVSVSTDPDQLPGDDHRDLAIEVQRRLPVLIVDGDPRNDARPRGSDFIRDALAPARDPNPGVLARVVPFPEFDGNSLTKPMDPSGVLPQVLVLADIPPLNEVQRHAVNAFLAEGGGLLVTLGGRANAREFNDAFHRDGKGWLPAALIEVEDLGDDPQKWISPLPASFLHPSLVLFREPMPGGLSDARVPRFWKLRAPEREGVSTLARFSNQQPFLAGKTHGNGRVIVSAIPFDPSWRSNLISLAAFAPLVHELVFELAGARGTRFNLSPGQPIRLTLDKGAPPTPWSLGLPNGTSQSLEPRQGRIVYEQTQEPGVYTLREPDSGRTFYFVVQPDERESDLTPLSEAEGDRLREMVPGLALYADEAAAQTALRQAARPADLWWLFLVGVLGLLVLELILTRKRALAADRPQTPD